jgi:hypothetical protein
MSNVVESRFEFDAVCEKAWQDDKGKMFVRAVASDDRLDLQRDRMGKNALSKMAEAAKNGLPFLETHRSVFEFGKTIGGEVIEGKDKDGKPVRQFVVELELDGEYPQARKLFKEVASGGCKRQLSIGGKLNLKNREAVTVEMTASGLSRTINDLDLDHIASTREKQAANPRTSFMEAISKALDDAKDEGWTGVEKDVAVEKTALTDKQMGEEFLAVLGKTVRKFGGTMKVTKEGTPVEEETPKTGETTTPGADADADAAAMEAKNKGLAAKTAKAVPTSEELARDIALLLAKSKTAGVGSPVYKSLWTLRYVVAKEAGAEGVTMTGSGPYAPSDLSAAPAGTDNDKATGDAAMAATAVTDHRRNNEAKGEIVSTAPTAKDALDLTMRTLAETGKLPQVGDNDRFGKSLTPETLEKTMGGWLEKSTEVQKSLLLATVERLTEDRQKDIEEVKKSVDQVGSVVNDSNKRLAEMDARIARVEKSGGVSQSGARGATDSTVSEPKRRGGLWVGMFNKAKGEALSQY